jgi:acylphosphatase
MIAKRVRIYGRVQGVCYRMWTGERASKYGLTGWVRNRSDGSVEALFQGDEELVKSMIRECRKGPDMAHVDNIETQDAALENLQDFSQRATL